MKKILILIVIAVGGWFAYMNWSSRSDQSTNDYAMDQYKKSMDKARDVEQTLQDAKDRLDNTQVN